MAQRLPNAPLTEVIFELRWALQGMATAPLPLQNDPGYFVLLEAFKGAIGKDGFIVQRDRPEAAQGILLGHSVRTQFLRAEDRPFPMFQLGQGIFASNEATEYEWARFKKHTLKGIERLLASYPKMSDYPLTPVHLELRYIDSFDADLLGHQNILRFLNGDTKISIEVPKDVIGPRCEELTNGNFFFEFPLSNVENTTFSFQVATGRRKTAPTILVISKVVTRSDKIEIGRGGRLTVQAIGKWMEDAHEVTSPFFRKLMRQRLMTKFKRKPAIRD